MKISKIIIDMGNNKLKEFEPIDAIILAICKGEKEQENVILEQLGNNPSLHLKMLVFFTIEFPHSLRKSKVNFIQPFQL